MPEWVVNKVAYGLNKHKKSINGSRILMLGIAYKKNVDDMRESPSVEMMERLQQRGAVVEYSDPYVPVFPKMRRYSFDLSSVELKAESIASFDCVVIGTNHDSFDCDMIRDNSVLIVDTRGVYRHEHENVIRA